jgi:hypothetical protein
LTPWKAAGVNDVPKTLVVLWLPAWPISKNAMMRKIRISNTPRIVPRPADVRTP